MNATMVRQDLPSRWDGHAVLWDGWVPAFATPDPGCPKCGTFHDRVRNWGRVGAWPSMSHLELARARSVGYRVVALRCLDCGQDTITDLLTGEWRDLADQDYV